jgi:homoserine dehydrogenase
VNAPVVRVGVLGCGTVGSSLIDLVARQRGEIEARTGIRLEVTRVAVRDTTRARGVDLAPGVLTTDPAAVVADPDVDVVVEVMGGVEPAESLLFAAMAAGKPVVTANKELLAHAGPEVFAAAETAKVDLLFEAAVAGGIPFVRPLRESLLGEPVHRVLGIMNGTTNYILTRMAESGADFADALAEAQALGYAEADPTADVDGLDAGAKIAIVASIAFGARLRASDVPCEGISELGANALAFAARHGYVVKLLAVAERFATPMGAEVVARVYPAFVPAAHPLAAVRDTYNAIFVQGAAVGDLMFYGRGAGGAPTASALLGDLIDAAVNLHRGAHASLGAFTDVPVRAVEDLASAFFVSVEVADRPGVLATIAGVFGSHGVSIASMAQEGPSHDPTVAPADGEARLDFVTHLANERSLASTLAELRALDEVHRVGSVVRVLGDDLGSGT